MVKKRNRLASLFADFVERFELPGRIDPDGLGADLGIPDGGRTIFAGYAFDPSEDHYEFGAVLGQVDVIDTPALSSEVMMSEPIRGITERIDDQGRLFVVGSRDNLRILPDADVQKGYLDDTARVLKASDQFKELIKQVLGKSD